MLKATQELRSLIKRLTQRIPFDIVQEYTTTAKLYRDEQADKSSIVVVVRLCTAKPLQDALSKSALRVPSIVEMLQGYEFRPEKILILKSPSCSSSKRTRTIPAELWITDSEDRLPTHTRKYRASDPMYQRVYKARKTN